MPVVVEGTIVGDVTVRAADRGAFAAFNYRRPRTLGRLRVENRWDAEAGIAVPARGTVLLKVNEPAPWLTEGQRVRVTGTLQAFTPPENPGSYDFAAAMARTGVGGRLTARRATGVVVLSPTPGPARNLALLKGGLRIRAWEGLRAGFADRSPDAALLGSLLLGRKDPALDQLRDDFRVVGLSHLLSISGAHLGILVILLIGLARALPVHPRIATLAVLAGLAFYLLLVPVRVPILRAALMALAFLGPGVLGRAVPPGRALTMAALVVLAWRPGELFSPGFQLSFLAVWAIVRFARPISEVLHPPPLVTDIGRSRTLRESAVRGFFDYLGVSLAAAAVTAPVVLHHFGLFSPLAVIGSVLSWPFFGAVLGLGHLKLALGLAAPEASAWLAWPLSLLLGGSAWLVHFAAGLPASAWAPALPVPLAWALAAVAAVIAGLSMTLPGVRFRPRGLAAVALVLGVWLSLSQDVLGRFDPPPLLRTTMIAVGDGSAWLVESGGGVMVFDCGSSTIAQVGEREIVPTLRALGVTRVDTLVVSHADLDHFSGVLELCDALPVARVVCSPEVPTEALDLPGGAAAVLLRGLRARGVPVETITAGDGWAIGNAGAVLPRALAAAGAHARRRRQLQRPFRRAADRAARLRRWRPPRPLRPALRRHPAARDHRVAGETPASSKSTLADIPHHGSLVRASPDWLAAADPAILLQSTGRRRLKLDKWAALLAERPRVRLASARVGMSRVEVLPDGSLRYETFRGGSGRVLPGVKDPETSTLLTP